MISGNKLLWRTAAECFDWSPPCPSIFASSAEIWAEHQLRAVRPLADAAMAHVARGMKRYVLEAERPFIVNLTHGDEPRISTSVQRHHPWRIEGRRRW